MPTPKLCGDHRKQRCGGGRGRFFVTEQPGALDLDEVSVWKVLDHLAYPSDREERIVVAPHEPNLDLDVLLHVSQHVDETHVEAARKFSVAAESRLAGEPAQCRPENPPAWRQR
jgi:hypothetical protein